MGLLRVCTGLFFHAVAQPFQFSVTTVIEHGEHPKVVMEAWEQTQDTHECEGIWCDMKGLQEGITYNQPPWIRLGSVKHAQ